MMIDKESIKDVRVGSQVSLLFDGDERNAIPATISKISDYNGESVVYLDSDYLNNNTVDIRTSYAQVIIKRYKGIKIDASSLRIKDGEKGVYVKTSVGTVFKKIEPIFSDEKYIICKEIPMDSTYLQAYDMVFVN